jgi:ATP-dependent RNA helicase DHX37/DHR1
MSSKKEKQKVSFEDLGLKTAVPAALTKTNAQKQAEKVAEKKMRNARIKDAVSQLEAVKSEVENHKQFVKMEEEKAAQEKRERQRLLQAEHIRSQNSRDALAKSRDRDFVARQAVVVEEMKQKILHDEAHQREVQRIIEKSVEEEILRAKPSVHVTVSRLPEIEETRAMLPVMREEQPIVEAITTSKGGCVLICGETGSGKTTQIPQFLWEAGYGSEAGAPLGRDGMIVVTEPRRVAAVSMAKRVAEELNETFGDAVAYQVRYENNVGANCRLKFVTEGILLREVQQDFLLRRYSVVIVDEAHERSISGDILIGLLSRIVPLRQSLFESNTMMDGKPVQPLAMVVMSATMRVSDFKDNRQLLPREPPLLNVEARRFPVTSHFAKKTELRQYCQEAFNKVTQIHKKLPPGGILIFLCTQREIESLCGQLKRHYRKTRIVYDEVNYKKQHMLRSQSAHNAASSVSAEDKDDFGLADHQYDLGGGTEDNGAPSHDLNDFGVKDGGAVPSNAEGKDDDDDNATVDSWDNANETTDDQGIPQPEDNEEDEADGVLDTLHILPLYALLNTDQQQRVFQPPPKGKRLCIVSTNVAETSITIPGIRYVVDTGRVKSKRLAEDTGATSYNIEWTSQASAEQRSGRAGRTGPGHCYRLYSTAVFANVMPKHSAPEILRTPVESVVLLMKTLGIDRVGNFPFPTPPAAEHIEQATKHLLALGALSTPSLHISPLGRNLARFPVPPRFAVMLQKAVELKDTRLMEYVVSVVALVSTTTDVFEHQAVQLASRKDGGEQLREVRQLLHPGSDLITYLRTMGVYQRRPTVATCVRYSLVHKPMQEAFQLKRQLRHTITTTQERDMLEDEEGAMEDDAEPEAAVDNASSSNSNGLPNISSETEVVLRKIFALGLIDQVARRATVHECRAANVDFERGSKTSKVPYKDIRSSAIVFIHPSSSVATTVPAPEFVVYASLQRTKRRSEDTKKTADGRTFMKGVTVMTKLWLDEIGFDEESVERLYQRPVVEESN